MKSSKSYWVLYCVILGFLLDNAPCNASKKYNRYLAHIFNKYGSGGTMSFEGLEHLMHSLGLGALEFNPTHTIAEHRPDGYKMPDLTLDDDLSGGDNDLSNAKYSSDAMEVRELPPSTSEDNKKTGQNLNELSDLNDENLLTINGNKLNFKEMHDPKHRHPRHHADPVSGNKCLSPKSIMKLVVDPDEIQDGQTLNYKITAHEGKSKRHAASPSSSHDEEESYTEFLSSLKITPIAFMKMCPALLAQIDQDACAKMIVPDHEISPTKYAYAWIYASIAILIISCCGLLGVAIVPLAKSVAYHEILKFLVAVAIGTLCGDALMHLLPHALGGGHGKEAESFGEGHDKEPVWLCGCAFATSLFMYSLETLLPLIRGNSDHHEHGHSHSTRSRPSRKASIATNIDMEIPAREQVSSAGAKELNVMLDEDKIDKKGISLSPVAFMVVLGDGLHNITDGLAIGAAFAGDPVTGMATALAVLCHELPHELGDFALLLQTGVNIKRAMFLNIVSSVLSFMGMAAGLLLAGMHTDMVKWIYASTAGSFLYIALSDLIPEMNREGKHDVKNCFIQIFGIFLGGAIMLAIAISEDDLKALFQ